MNEVYEDILEQVKKVKSTELIAVDRHNYNSLLWLKDRAYRVHGFHIWMSDCFTMRIYTYSFNSRMSDDELEDTFAQFIEKLNVLRNLNYPTK